MLSRETSNPANEICLGDVVREREGPEIAYGFAQKFWPNPALHSDAAKSAAPVSLGGRLRQWKFQKDKNSNPIDSILIF